MAGTETKRIIELTEASTVQSGDFIAVDSNARGTKKVSTDTLATSAALTAETNARAGADEQMSERMDGIEEQTALIQNPTKTVSGSLVSFTDGADMPMVACRAEIVPKQSGTGTPSPDNVRPISGWSSVDVYDTGVNLFDKSVMAKNWYITGSNTIGNGGTCLLFSVPIGTAFTVSGTNGGRNRLLASDKPYNELAVGDALTSLSNTNLPLHLTSQYRTYIYYCETSFNQAIADSIQVEVGNTATTFEPYIGTTTTVNLGRTVYGGTLDVVTGVLTVDRAYKTINDFNWTYNASNKVFWVNIPEMLRPCTLLSSHYSQSIVSSLADIPNYCVWNKSYGFTANNLVVKDTRFTDASSFKTNMSGVQLVYELATPQTYTLTGQEVETLLGENNVWADSGDVEITYRRDISIVINNLESALNG